jgi:hypothetical protein
MADAATTARNNRLDQLSQAAQDWGKSQTDQLNNRVSSAKAILKGRTGSERLAQATVDATSSLVVAQINDFLTG